MITETRLTLGELLRTTAGSHPDRVLLEFENESYTYSEFEALSCQAARVWQDLGVGPGDRVVFLLENSAEFLIGFVGLSRIGACMVALNPNLQADDVGYMIKDSGAKALLTSPSLLQLAQEAARSVEANPTIVISGKVEGFVSFSDSLTHAESTWINQASHTDHLSIIYTSGSTGRPKGVVHTHESLIYFGQGYASWLQLNASDRVYVCLPLYHVNAQAYSFLGVLAAQCRMVLARKYSRSRFWGDVSKSQVTVTNLISLMLAVLTDLQDDDLDLAKTLRIAYGSAIGRLSPVERTGLEQRLNMVLRTGYGMSETGYGFIEPLEGPLREGSVGRIRRHPNPEVAESEAKIVDPQGKQVSPGEVGELLLKNPAMMLGYLKDGAPDASVLSDGWFATGDYFTRDSEGYFYFVGRQKEIVRRRGEKISTAEIESALNGMDEVSEAAVLGIPSNLGDEEIYAFILPSNDSVSAEGLWAAAAAVLPAFKIPRYLHFIQEMPRTPSQKIAKSELRKMADLSIAADREALLAPLSSRPSGDSPEEMSPQ